jgi:hypothetical protein
MDKLQYIYNLVRILPTSRLVTFYLKNVTDSSLNKDLPTIQISDNSLIWNANKDLLWQWNLKLPVSLYDFLNKYIQYSPSMQQINYIISSNLIRLNILPLQEPSPFKLNIDKLFTHSKLFNRLAYLIFIQEYDYLLNEDNKKNIAQVREFFQNAIHNTKSMLTEFLAKTKIIVKQVTQSPPFFQDKYQDGNRLTHLYTILIPNYYPTLFGLLNHAYDDYLNQENLNWVERNKPILFKLAPPSSYEKFIQLFFKTKENAEEHKKKDPTIQCFLKNSWNTIVESHVDTGPLVPTSFTRTNTSSSSLPAK